MSQNTHPRIRNGGIQTSALLEWVESSAPFLFSISSEPDPSGLRYLDVLRMGKKNPPDPSDLWGYFELCLAAHFATVGSFVPTDVDIAIRERLWSFVDSPTWFLPMWERVMEFRLWNPAPVTRRQVGEGEWTLTGHQGEWMTVAVAAYATALRIQAPELPMIREALEEEVDREERAILILRDRFLESQSLADMRDYLAGVSAIAHNLGDLDRMITAYDLSETDVLKRRVFRAGHKDARNPRAVFLQCGRVYQTLLAPENHRNFALRAPKGLRKSGKFLLPFGLFLDEWGETLIQEGWGPGVLSEGDLREIIEALVLGWKRLNPSSIYTSQGYSRALAGIMKALGGMDQILKWVPPVIQKELEHGGLRTLMGVSRDDFERKIRARVKVLLGETLT